MRSAIVVLVSMLCSACGLALDSAGKAASVDETPPTAVPRADCGPGSSPENGLQGQVPQVDRQSGRSAEGYWCNLELVGHWRHGEGASWQFAWYDDCGYYGTLMNDTRTTEEGAVVVDASDPANPIETAVLNTPAVMDPHESPRAADCAIHQQRLAVQGIAGHGCGGRNESIHRRAIHETTGGAGGADA